MKISKEQFTIINPTYNRRKGQQHYLTIDAKWGYILSRNAAIEQILKFDSREAAQKVIDSLNPEKNFVYKGLEIINL